MLQVVSHNESNIWSKQEYIKLVNKNWPDLLDTCRLIGASIEQEITDSEMGDLHKSHINTFVQLDDDIYMPLGGGETFDGTPIKQMLKYNKIHNYLKQVEMIMCDEFWKMIENSGIDLSRDVIVELKLHSLVLYKYVIALVKNTNLAYMFYQENEKGKLAIGLKDDVLGMV